MNSYNVSARIKNIRVTFYLPVDSSHFNQRAFQDIKSRGLFLTDLSLIHYASIRYQSRFRDDLSRRLRYTFDTIEPSLLNTNATDFYFNDFEDSETQKSSSEVIGVGFALHLMHKLLDTNMNRIHPIPAQGRKKRCDFEVLKNGYRYIVESKGWKTNIKTAMAKIRAQKKSYGVLPKYGVITHIPRDGTPCKIHCIDPEIDLPEVSREYLAISLLEHYSKTLRLAGFPSFSEQLNNRIDDITSAKDRIRKFENISLKFGNLQNVGESISVPIDSSKVEFLSGYNMDLGLKVDLSDGSILKFGISTDVLKLLENQDFDKLISYHLINQSKESYSILDDGTLITQTKKLRRNENISV